jgi:hypothetical protein
LQVSCDRAKSCLRELVANKNHVIFLLQGPFTKIYFILFLHVKKERKIYEIACNDVKEN